MERRQSDVRNQADKKRNYGTYDDFVDRSKREKMKKIFSYNINEYFG